MRWPDFRLPGDPEQLRRVLGEALARADGERVELACRGGTGRTGTALACLVVLDGVPPDRAVAWVRAHYRPRAVETWSQRRMVRDWNGPLAGPRPARSGGRGARGSFFSRG